MSNSCGTSNSTERFDPEGLLQLLDWSNSWRLLLCVGLCLFLDWSNTWRNVLLNYLCHVNCSLTPTWRINILTWMDQLQYHICQVYLFLFTARTGAVLLSSHSLIAGGSTVTCSPGLPMLGMTWYNYTSMQWDYANCSWRCARPNPAQDQSAPMSEVRS